MSDETQKETTPLKVYTPDFLTETRFDQFDLPMEILSGLDDLGFKFCTPIQAQTLPVALEARDVAGQAQTGTGKTFAYMIPVFNKLIRNKEKKAGMPRALIVAPTRELAFQVYEDAQMLGKYTGLTLAIAFGGIDYREQADAISRGPDVVICTPGRIIDYLKQGIFKTSQIESLVIDEADRLFDLGFIKDLRFLLRKLPSFEKRQSMLFSATLSYRVLELTYDFMNMPEFISVTPQDLTVEGVEQSLYHVGLDEKFSLLLGILEKEPWERLLIFANTKAGVEWVARKLQGNGLPAEGITGDLPQPKRLKLMEQFKDGSLKILVATDVASRGIHIEDISHVINYDIPQDAENYVHRIGRTARAGKTGRAITFACENYVFHLEAVEEMLGFKIPVVFVDESLLKEDKAGDVRTGWGDRRGKPRPSRGRPERGRPPRGEARGEARGESRGEGRGRARGEIRGEARGEIRGEARGEAGGEERERRRPPARRITVSTRPGGIFGLKPGSRAAMAAPAAAPVTPPPPPSFTEGLGPEAPVMDLETVAEPKKKKKRRRRKRKPAEQRIEAVAGDNGGEE